VYTEFLTTVWRFLVLRVKKPASKQGGELRIYRKKKESRAADKGWSSGLGTERRINNSSEQKPECYKIKSESKTSMPCFEDLSKEKWTHFKIKPSIEACVWPKFITS
jgi:hypothetical protein